MSDDFIPAPYVGYKEAWVTAYHSLYGPMDQDESIGDARITAATDLMMADVMKANGPDATGLTEADAQAAITAHLDLLIGLPRPFDTNFNLFSEIPPREVPEFNLLSHVLAVPALRRRLEDSFALMLYYNVDGLYAGLKEVGWELQSEREDDLAAAGCEAACSLADLMRWARVQERKRVAALTVEERNIECKHNCAAHNEKIRLTGTASSTRDYDPGDGFPF